MMGETTYKRFTATIIGTLLACLCALAFGMPQSAHAVELQAGTLSTQGGGGDSPVTATTIGFNRDYYGSTDGLHRSDCYTYYKFTASKYSSMTYKVSIVANGSQTVYYNVEDEDYGFPWGSSNWSCSAGQGSTQELTLNPGKTYYVRIGKSYYDSSPASYVLRVKKVVGKPLAPVVKSVNAGKKKVTVKYYKTDLAKKYEVALKGGGQGWHRYDNGTKLSRTFVGLQGGKSYTVKVRAKRYVEGKWYAGSWSAPQKVKVRR